MVNPLKTKQVMIAMSNMDSRMDSTSKRMVDMWDNFSSQPVKDESVVINITLSGPEASTFMLEASSRGISANEFAKILIGQGLFFWAKQT